MRPGPAGRRAAATGAALLAAAFAPAAAEVLTIEWDGGGRYQRTLQLGPAKLAEACVKLPAGQAVRWSFEAGAALDFNVHYHVDKDVVYPVKRSGVARAADTLTASIEQDYCWMWSNRSAAPVTLTLKLAR